MPNMRYRVALPIVFGGLAVVLMAWDIHNTQVIESMGIAWDTDAPIWPYRASFLILFTVNFPAFLLAAPFFLLDQLQAYPRRIMILPLIALWWWIGTRIDFGILGRRRYRHPKATAGILVGMAAGLLSWALYTGVAEFQFWKEYGLALRANYLVLLSGTTIPIVSWCLVLAGCALMGARRLYSNR